MALLSAVVDNAKLERGRPKRAQAGDAENGVQIDKYRSRHYPSFRNVSS